MIKKILFNALLMINLTSSQENQEESYHLFHSAGQEFRSIYTIMMNGFKQYNHIYSNYNSLKYICLWDITKGINPKLNLKANLNNIIKINLEKYLLQESYKNYLSSFYTINNGGFYINEQKENIEIEHKGIFEEVRTRNNIAPEKIKLFYGLRNCMEKNILDMNSFDLDRLNYERDLIKLKEKVLLKYNSDIKFFEDDLGIEIDKKKSDEIINNFLDQFSEKLHEKDENGNFKYCYSTNNNLLFNLKEMNIFFAKVLNDHLKENLKIKNPKFQDYIKYCNIKRKKNGLSQIDIVVGSSLLEENYIKNLSFFDNLKIKIKKNNFYNNISHKIYLNQNKKFPTFFPYKAPYGLKSAVNDEFCAINNVVNFYYNYADRLKELDLFENEELEEIKKIKFDLLNNINYVDREYKYKIFGVQFETIKKLMNKKKISTLKLIDKGKKKEKVIFENNNGKINLFFKNENYQNYKKKENLFDRISRLTRRENPEFFSLEEQEKKLRERTYIYNHIKQTKSQIEDYSHFMSKFIINNYGY